MVGHLPLARHFSHLLYSFDIKLAPLVLGTGNYGFLLVVIFSLPIIKTVQFLTAIQLLVDDKLYTHFDIVCRHSSVLNQ